MKMLLSTMDHLVATGRIDADGVSFSGIALKVLGPRGAAVVDFCLVTSQMGFSIA